MSSTHADFSQNDPRWSSNKLGFSSWEKLGPYGCFVTAMANVAQAQGMDVTPAQMNDQLKAHGLFVRDGYGQIADIAGYQALGVVAPHSRFVEQKNYPGTTVAPAGYFDVAHSTDTEIIIKIDSHPEQAGVQSHYVRVIGLANGGKDLEIIDSWDGKRKLLSAYANRGHKTPFQIIWTTGKYRKV